MTKERENVLGTAIGAGIFFAFAFLGIAKIEYLYAFLPLGIMAASISYCLHRHYKKKGEIDRANANSEEIEGGDGI